jgi:hypothetical protein
MRNRLPLSLLCRSTNSPKQASMNRAYITPKNDISIPAETMVRLIERGEALMSHPTKRAECQGAMHIDFDGKRYSGQGTVSAMNDLQFDVDAVTAIPAQAAAKVNPIKRIGTPPPPAKKAAKKAAPKRKK